MTDNPASDTSDEQLLRALAAQEVPSSVLEASRTRPVPEGGQVWRARWEIRAATVLVLSTDREDLEVVGASISSDEESPHVRTLTSAESGLAVDLTVWPSERMHVSMRVLETLFVPRTASTATFARSIADMPTGNVDVPTSRESAARLDALASMRETRWALSDARSLRTVLRAAGISPSRLGQILGIETAAAVTLFKGRGELTTDQVERIAVGTGIPRSVLVETGIAIPDDLVEAVDLPMSRPLIDLVARRHGVGELDARRLLSKSAISLAARQTGPKQENWASRLEHAARKLAEGDES